jgi:hypothetical protein
VRPRGAARFKAGQSWWAQAADRRAAGPARPTPWAPSDLRRSLPDGGWAACADPGRAVPDGADVVLGFHRSFRAAAPPWSPSPSSRARTPPGRAVGGPEGSRTGAPQWSRSRTPSAPAGAGACSRSPPTPTAGRARSSCWTPRGSPWASSHSHPTRMGPATAWIYAATATGCCPTTGRRRWPATSPTRCAKKTHAGAPGRWAQAVSRPVGPAQAGRAWIPVGRLPPSHG